MTRRGFLNSSLAAISLRRDYPQVAAGYQSILRFLALAKRGHSHDKPHVTADVAEVREQYMDTLNLQQMDHMTRSLEYCRRTLNLGIRWRA